MLRWPRARLTCMAKTTCPFGLFGKRDLLLCPRRAPYCTHSHTRASVDTHTPHVHYITHPGLGSLREIASSLRGCLYNLASSECHFAYTCSHTHAHTHTFYKHARNKHQQKRTRREILAHLVHLLVHLCQRVPPARTRLSERHSLSKTLSLSRARCRHSSACRGIQKY